MTKDINDERFYWIWLSEFLGVGSSATTEALEIFGSPEAIYLCDDEKLVASNIFQSGELKRKNKIESKKILDILSYCDQNNIRVVSFFDDEYPLSLKNIENPPVLIYVRGMDLRKIFPAFGIVGTRKPTVVGIKSAFSIGAKLGLSGFTIVSGGALGIDKAAHLGAVSAGCKTVAVLGSGIDSDYLKANKDIRTAIEQNGALISEFPPKFPASKYTFPIRNRLISGLSCGVAVIEAGEKSGALITATHAMEQGREVFTIPGDINKEEYKGNNRLIKDGAIPITDINDILSVYSGRLGDMLNYNAVLTKKVTAPLYSELEKAEKKGRKLKADALPKKKIKSNEAEKTGKENEFILPDLNNINCSEHAKKILSVFEEEIMFSDSLSAKSGVTGAEFIAAVTELELKGYIKAVPVGRYALANVHKV